MQRAFARAARAIFPSLLETRSSARLAFERELASTRRFRIENLELRLIKNEATLSYSWAQNVQGDLRS